MPHASIAIVGSGIAGNSAAWALARHLDVTQYEAEGRFGGHACTCMISKGVKIFDFQGIGEL